MEEGSGVEPPSLRSNGLARRQQTIPLVPSSCLEEGGGIEPPSFRSAGFQDQWQTIPPAPSSIYSNTNSTRISCTRCLLVE
jgi:hypothetical protein